jgi:hypothetical protein
MKKIIKKWLCGMIGVTMLSQVSFAQKIDESRMTRDIEVAENVLSTLIKQEMTANSQRTYFGLDVKGFYQEGYGVTFRLPSDYSMPMAAIGGEGNVWISKDVVEPAVVYSFDEGTRVMAPRPDQKPRVEVTPGAKTLNGTLAEKRKVKSDSVRDAYNIKMIKAAKDFVVDYGDLISQLSPNERIVVTNQGENRSWYFKEAKRRHVSIEGLKSDVVAFKQGKLTRDQALAKLKVVNTEYVELKEPDMELLASIFNRLYRTDLSTTYFVENNMYYERLKDYGAIYYMQVYSSQDAGYGKYALPTQNIDEVDEATRDKKAAELYPKFESELKENILEYGRTLKSLKDDEVLVFNVTLTKCKQKGCGIPSSLELTIKGSTLKDFSASKIDKNAALAKFTAKKGPNQ